MTRSKFLKEVVEIYFRDNLESVDTAINIAIVELRISRNEFIQWFGKSGKRFIQSTPKPL